MEDIIKNSVTSRKEAIFNIYDIKDSKLLKEIDELFTKMEDLAKDCKDTMEFETKLASSPLNQEYLDLFTKISQSSNYILKENDTVASEVKTDEEYVKEEIISDTKRTIKDITRPVKRNAREHAMGKLRTTPIIGDILGVKQTMDLFGGFKRKKQYQEEQAKLQRELEEAKKQN